MQIIYLSVFDGLCVSHKFLRILQVGPHEPLQKKTLHLWCEFSCTLIRLLTGNALRLTLVSLYSFKKVDDIRTSVMKVKFHRHRDNRACSIVAVRPFWKSITNKLTIETLGHVPLWQHTNCGSVLLTHCYLFHWYDFDLTDRIPLPLLIKMDRILAWAMIYREKWQAGMKSCLCLENKAVCFPD